MKTRTAEALAASASPGLWMIFFIVHTSVLVVPVVHGQRCAFTGSCYFDKNIDKPIPCAVDQPPAESLPADLWNEFVEFCDDLSPTLEDRRLCCDAAQFRTLKKEMVSAEAIGMKRCPGCYRAFKNLMCQMTCSPRQADFVVVNATKNVVGASGPALQEIVYGLDKSFADTLYTACNSARSNLYVKLTTLMCGRYANRCSTKRFLRFLGSTDSEGGYSPFKIRHLLLDEPSNNGGVKVINYLGQEKTVHSEPWRAYAKCND